MSRAARAAVLSLLIAAAALGTPPTAASATSLQTPRVTETTLRNGLRVVVVEDHRTALADVEMWYRYGTDDEPAGDDGIAHALEHMMFRGTHAFPGAASLQLEARLGGRHNAETERQHTRYVDTVPAADADAALRTEADRMRGLLLEEHDWRSEREAILAEVRQSESSRSTVIENAVRARAYGATAFGHGGFGVPRTLRRLTVADLRRAYERAYAPGNAVLVIAGDVRPARMFASARRFFGAIAGRTHRIRHAAEPPPERGFVVHARMPGAAVVDIALESHGEDAADGAAEGVAAELIDPDHPALSDALDIACSKYVVDDDTETGGGLYHVLCTVRMGYTARDVVALFRERLRSLAAHPPHALIEHAKRALIGTTAFSLDDFGAEAELYARSYALDDTDPRTYDAQTARVSDGAVAAVLRRWSAPVGIGIVASSTGGHGIRVLDGPKRAAPRTAGEQPSQAWSERVVSDTASAPLRLPATEEPAAFALSNGVRVFVQRTSHNGTAYVRAGFDDPNTFGTPLEMGIGRLAEYLIAYGTRRWPTERVERAAEERGMTVELGARTDMQGYARDLPVMLDILSDAWSHPPLDEQSLYRAKAGVAFAALRMDRDPDETADMVLTRQLFRPSTSLTSAVLSVIHATRTQVRDYFDRHVRPDRAWIAVAGDVDAERVRAQLTRTLGTWRAAAVDPASPRPEVAAHADSSIVPVERPSIRVELAQPVPPLEEPDATAFTLLSAVIGGGSFDTRLMRELRVRRALSYFAAGEYSPSRNALLIALDCSPGRVARCSEIARSVLRDVSAHPPGAHELAVVRHRLVLEALIDASTPDGVLDRLADAARRHRAPESLGDLQRRLWSVPDEAVGAAARFLEPDRLIEVDEGIATARRSS